MTPSKETKREAAGQKLLCQECNDRAVLYQCPRCSFRSCSLACCTAHKRRGCNGKRDATAFLTLHQMTDETVTSDYLFLQTVLSSVDAAQRNGGSNKAANHQVRKKSRLDELSSTSDAHEEPSHPMLTAAATANNTGIPKLPTAAQTKGSSRSFVTAAAASGVTVLLVPSGLERHSANKSRLKHGVLHWTVEWRLHSSSLATNSTPTTTMTRFVSEKTTLEDVLVELLKDPHHSQDCRILLKRMPGPANRVRYFEIDKSETLCQALRSKTVVEFPTLEIVPSSRTSEFPLFIERVDEGDADSMTNL